MLKDSMEVYRIGRSLGSIGTAQDSCPSDLLVKVDCKDRIVLIEKGNVRDMSTAIEVYYSRFSSDRSH